MNLPVHHDDRHGLDELEEAISGFSGKQQAYLSRFVYEGKRAARDAAGVSVQAISWWRKHTPGFVEAEQHVEHTMRGVQAALARGIMASAVAMVAEKMVETALSDATTDRQLSVRQRAQERVLEYTGVVTVTSGVTVNVDNRRLDVRLHSCVRVDYPATKAWRRVRHVPAPLEP